MAYGRDFTPKVIPFEGTEFIITIRLVAKLVNDVTRLDRDTVRFRLTLRPTPKLEQLMD